MGSQGQKQQGVWIVPGQFQKWMQLYWSRTRQLFSLRCLSVRCACQSAWCGAELLTERGDKRRGGFVAAGQRDIGNRLALLQQRERAEQAQTLAPGAEAEAGVMLELAGQGFLRDLEALAPLLQAE